MRVLCRYLLVIDNKGKIFDLGVIEKLLKNRRKEAEASLPWLSHANSGKGSECTLIKSRKDITGENNALFKKRFLI